PLDQLVPAATDADPNHGQRVSLKANGKRNAGSLPQEASAIINNSTQGGMVGDPTGVVPMDGARGVASMAHQQARAAARGGAAGPASQIQVVTGAPGINPEIMFHPMYLGTIVRKLDKKGSGGYVKHEDFSSDVNLVFDNAMTCNQKESEVYLVAEKMKKDFMKDWAQALKRLESEENGR
ncbi:unnamed protein product, partial [Ascophyllum nodosum]